MRGAFIVLCLPLSIGVAAQPPPAPLPKGQMPVLGRPTESTDTVPLFDFDAYFSGAWEFEWSVPTGPLGPGGPISGTTTYRALGGSLYEAETRADGPAGPYTVKERLEYQKDAKTITRQVTDSRGFTYVSQASVAGDLGGIYNILFESEPFVVGGTSVRLKESLRTMSPFNYRVSAALSVDGGPFTNFGTPWWRKQVK